MTQNCLDMNFITYLIYLIGICFSVYLSYKKGYSDAFSEMVAIMEKENKNKKDD